MQPDTLIIRYSEIGLKGKNRPIFEKRLAANIKDCLKKNSIECSPMLSRSRIILKTKNKDSAKKLVRVFGIYSISPAVEVSVNGLSAKAVELAKASLQPGLTFAVRARRLTKESAKSSTQLNNELGKLILDETKASVNLSKPDVIFGIEISGNKAYLFTETIKGFGGLPAGIEGNVNCLLEDESSVLACLLVMKRGCSVSLAGFEKKDISLIERFAYGFSLKFKKIENIKEIEDTDAIVVGQTLENFKELDVGTVVLRPLIGYDKKQIREELNKFENASLY